mgnify:CR=1 FL=1
MVLKEIFGVYMIIQTIQDFLDYIIHLMEVYMLTGNKVVREYNLH